MILQKYESFFSGRKSGVPDPLLNHLMTREIIYIIIMYIRGYTPLVIFSFSNNNIKEWKIPKSNKA